MSDIEKAKELIFEFNLVNANINPFFTFEELKERSFENLYEKLNPILIPAEGPADTLAGELLRAYQHIQYKWVNDEDSPFSGPDGYNPRYPRHRISFLYPQIQSYV